MAAMLEFAGIMFLQRKNEIRSPNKVSTKGRFLRRGSFEMKKLYTKVDGVSLILFPFAYLVFNVAYWTINLAHM